MADSSESFQEKTEEPTSKRISDARKEGRVAQSQELGSAVILLGGVLLLLFMGAGMVQSLRDAFHIIYQVVPTADLTVSNVSAYARSGAWFIVKVVGPFALTLLVLGVLARLLQVGWLFTGKTLEPRLEKINPFTNLKRLLSSVVWVELVKGVLKIIIVGLVAWLALRNELPRFVLLIDQDIHAIIGHIGKVAFKVAVRTSIAILILAILDFAYQKWKYKKDLRMTKQEVKDELKQTEGNPEIKGHMRQIQLKTSLNRMIKGLPQADVIVTNPVHVAVALKYNPATMAAPRVIAKGARKLAERIKSLAREYNIPIVEEPELARALYKSVDVGWEIPYNLYQAVAEVLALVYKIKVGNLMNYELGITN
ncbi:MAG: flagellar biosynthesis protein FlhB [Calditrichota bacterium]